jgi:LysM repeat protein
MKNRFWIILLIIIFSSSVSACEKSASNAPIATPTEKGSLPFPSPLPSSVINSILAGTQTAQALAKVTVATNVPTSKATNSNTPSIPTATQMVVQVMPTETKIVATAIVVPSATPGRPATYTLQQGEYPFCIARRFNVNATDILTINGLTLNSHPAADTVLKIPQTGVWSSGARALIPHPATYDVNAGDTIFTIACAFGDVDPNAIIIANALQSPYTLSAGQTLNIP